MAKFRRAAFNDGDTPITQVSSVRIVTQDSAVSRVFPYPVVNNSVAAHGRGAAYPNVMVANDAPEGQVVTLTVEVDYLRNGNAETMRLPHTLVIGPGTPAPGVSLSLDLVGMDDGDFRNSNKDGFFAPGEIISIQSRVRNWVRVAAAIGSPTLTTTDPYVTATVGGALTPLPWNLLGPVDSKGLRGALTLSPSAPVGHRVEFTMNVPYQMNGQSGVASIPLSFVVSVP